VILLIAVASGFIFGLGQACWLGQIYQPPVLKHLWLVLVSFLPQFIAIYFPNTRGQIPDEWAGRILIASQLGLLGFAWLNRNQLGMKILFVGAALNFTVITTNGGFMPISPETASRLVSEKVLSDIPLGTRFGTKDILLLKEDTYFEYLADRFLPPAWFSYQVAFSLGDVFLAIGIFWLLAIQTIKERTSP
jgi:hypothetical protein